MNFENPNPFPIGVTARNFSGQSYKATSNLDYRRQKLPSPFGAETKAFPEVEDARRWLNSLKCGGTIGKWNPQTKVYEPVEAVEPCKAVAK